ncbi:EF-P beta-lysylation protein EpmB [Marinomonas colpomeniae]|uniref:L-lysine 2,3-aminomutase n=1 Tax=Marinomonas colpomeniae TaxID=2774408 RepID=A0ABR8NU52_9GAMM|nr:EF-P beta-lysylation protein EpmB [Marinomonas colpomeniae]MBD5769583.1 EF-P beta-lysylation protein EpmB [Marinomonas colpomeniae]
MIPIQTNNQTENELSWSQHLSRAITSLPKLIYHLGLPESLIEQGTEAHQSFKLLVPRPYLSRIEYGNPNDPLLLQILPSATEMQKVLGYNKDPLEEADHNPQKAIVHKYKRRLLVITTGTCAVNCRYCFRRHFPYGDNQLAQAEWQSVIDYLQAHPDVNEVILSGGDPLMMKDALLVKKIRQLEALPQIKRLRIHSRLPVVIPARVTKDMIDWIRASRLDIIMVWHINHANEMDEELAQAAFKLKQAGVTVLNQGVLLKGINDSVEAQVNLSEAVFSAGILPYYMFTLDPVEGAAHFDISVEDAQKLMGKVAAELPGYLVPKLAKEIPGQTSKTVFAPIN